MDAHPAASIFPLMSEQEYAGLLEDIRQHGLREPIVVDSKTKTILDGRNRYRACRESETVPEFEWYDGDDPTGYVVSLNMHRRHLNESQRAMIAARLANLPKGVRADRVDTQICVSTQSDAARKLNVSPRSVQAARAVLDQADPETIAAVDAGKVKVSAAAKVTKAAKEREAMAAIAVTLPPTCHIDVADITGGLLALADASIDAIVTDPPYGADALPLYSHLATVAARVLKPGAPLLVMAGQYALPDVMHALGNALEYQWMLAYLTPGGQSPQIWPRHINTFWKPVLWYAAPLAGELEGWRGDVIKTPINDNDKRFHAWGQNVTGFTEIIQRFTIPGDLILDPFVGGGTTAVAAVQSGRAFVGFDCDAEHVETARLRAGAAAHV